MRKHESQKCKSNKRLLSGANSITITDHCGLAGTKRPSIRDAMGQQQWHMIAILNKERS